MAYWVGSSGSARRPRGVHLVGSVPLRDNETVFREVAARLGKHLRRIPDGETDKRTNWIQWQFPLLQGIPQFEQAPDAPAGVYRNLAAPRLRLREGSSINEVVLPDLGYRAAAVESYAVFSRLKSGGVIGPRVRFQVSLPTPLAVVHGRFVPLDQEAVEDLYERKLLEELDGILSSVPADQLAVQWDTAVEFSLLEGLLDSFITDREAGVLERLLRLGGRVPEDVQLGYHLCYGDNQHKHFHEPSDASKLAMVANGVSAGLQRPLNWVHMPVPRDRTDEAYFAPLRNLRVRPETEVYLGLVHMTDGVEGARARIAAAQTVAGSFGVATECGFGRRDPDTVPELMAIHSRVADPL